MFFLILTCLSACFVINPHNTTTKVLYKERFSGDEGLKIIFLKNPYDRSFLILLKRNDVLAERFEILDVPARFVINKQILPEKAVRSLYRMISDTANGQLKCIDFTFLRNQNTPAVLSTFVPLTEKEIKVIEIFSKVLADNNLDMQFSEELKRMKGWVRINY